MQNSLAAVSLALAALATVGAGWALVENQKLRTQLRERSLLPDPGEDPLTAGTAGAKAALPPAEVARRLTALDQRLEQMDDAVAAHDRRLHEQAATLEVRGTAPQAPAGAGAAGTGGVDVQTGGSSLSDAQLRAMIDKRVEEKVQAGKVRERKKPSIDAVAAHLKLTDVQRAELERTVARGKQEIFQTLKIPAADGTVFTDAVVDIIVASVVEGEDKAKPRFIGLFARLGTETIPGTDETYAQRMETIKAGVRQTLQRDMTPDQFAEFQKMKVAEDPTEMQGIHGDPWQEIMGDVAKKLPEDKKKDFEAWQQSQQQGDGE